MSVSYEHRMITTTSDNGWMNGEVLPHISYICLMLLLVMMAVCGVIESCVVGVVDSCLEHLEK